jgi:hypothetical protein
MVASRHAVEAAGIAPASREDATNLEEMTCAAECPFRLGIGWEPASLSPGLETVIRAWSRVSPDVRDAILRMVERAQ